MCLREYYSSVWLLAAAVVLAVSLPVSAQGRNETRIIGGVTTTVANIPYIARILFDGEFICGGSIISDIWVLSAAHCAYGNGPQRFKVRGGSTFVKGDGGVTIGVERILLPTKYNPKTHDMDASMFKLVSSILGPNRKAIALADKPVPNGKWVRVSGWGLTSEDGNISNQLRTVRVPIVPRAECKQDYKGTGNVVTNTMICASVPGTKDSCSGDSGGPLVFNGKLSGVVSWGIGCARPEFPGVYGDVLAFTNFIKQVMRVHS